MLDLLTPYLERHCARGAKVTPRPRLRKHLENAYAQLGVHTRTAAVAALR